MTRSPLWREFESGNSLLLVALRWVIMGGGIVFLIFTGMLDLTWPQQAVFGLLTVLVALWMDRSSTSYLLTLTLMILSMYSTFRYGFWRISYVVRFFLDPGTKWTPLDMFFILLLVLAESYAFVILFLGFMQTLWPLRRTPVPLPDDLDTWPAVDLLIPTYNEPLSVVRFTALAALNIDWPADKLNVYILDDGKRDEFRRFAEEAGVGYMTREDNRHAKAGNINHALQHLHSPFTAIFDCDHVPTRSFLQVTMGWFLRDRKLGLLQTPHHFYSPDPFERNLSQFRVIPNEGELFYGVVQDGNDFWNATFFCGSCAVLRRTALDEIGGIAVETVTEDAHTSLRMQINGWNTAYINIPQAAGLATERLSGHVKQRIRWARGMIQILRTDNPLFARGLSAAQRLCYFNAMTHFLYALPRLIFLTAPLIYLIFGHTNVPGYWAAILAFAFPHLVLSALANSRIQGQHRHSFWNEIYETVLSPYIFLPTMLALVNPRLGSFNVTAKGGVVNRGFYDARIARPFLVLLLMNFFGILMAIPRYWHVPLLEFLYDGTHPGTIVMNLIWTVFNIVILGVATAVAWESQQRRTTVRVSMSVPADVVLPNGAVVQGITADLSSGGVRMQTDRTITVQPGDSIKLVFPVLDGDATLPATVVSADGPNLRAQFDALTLQEEEALTMILYSRADTWLGWGEAREPDRPLVSLARILRLSLYGLAQTFRNMMTASRKAARKKDGRPHLTAKVAAPLLALFAVFFGATLGAQIPVQMPTASSPAAALQPGPAQQAPAPGTFDNTFTLADINYPDTTVLHGVDASRSIYFSVPQTQVVKTAILRLHYHFSPGLIPQLSHLKVSLNGSLVAVLPVVRQPTVSGESFDLTPEQKMAAQEAPGPPPAENSSMLEATLALPADMLVHNNELTFEFIGHYTLQCEDPSNSTLWAHVDSGSTIELAGSLLPLQNDLKLLPLPFYDSAVNLHPVIPIVFLSQPSAKALRAAGIVASWFGFLPDDLRAVRFPVSMGTIPSGNAIVFSENSGELPASLNVASSSGPTIAMRTNPVDPYSKILVLTGDSPEDLLEASEALVLQQGMLAGPESSARVLKLPARRRPDDAPRWMSTDSTTTFGDLSNTGDLQTDGSGPLNVYLRVPPDLDIKDLNHDLAFHLHYRYNGIPLSNESTLQVYMNGAYVSSTPLPHTDNASADIRTVVAIPRVDMRPFSNSLSLRFVFQIAKKGKCQDTAPNNLKGVVIKDSYLDISDIPHLAILPDLELFSNAGYPFTRRADLSDTAVVLPDTPSAEEIELYLTLMGHFGAQTGYPVLNVTVMNNDGMRKGSGKDYLVLGTVDDQPALSRLGNELPVKVDGGGLHVQDTQGFFAPLQHAWWKVRSSDHVENGQLETAGGLPDALIEGLEWPSGSRHSVVLIALKNKSVIPNFLHVFLKNAQSSDIQQSVSVLQGSRFESYRIGDSVYKVGALSAVFQARLFFSQAPAVVVVILIVFALLMAALIRASLRRRARARLQGND